MVANTARFHRLPLVAFALLLGATADLHAQAAQDNSVKRTAAQQKLVTLPNIARVVSPGLSLSFDATTDEKKGSVAVAVANEGDTFTFSLTASGPLDKETKEAKPLNLEGLSSGAVLDLGLNWFYWRAGTGNSQAAEDFCLEKTRKRECDDDSFANADDQKHFNALTGADQNPWIFSLTASVGRTDFKYLTAADLQSKSEQQNDVAFGFSVGQYEPVRGYIAVGYEYQRAWEPAGGARQICLPLATSIAGTQECKTAVIGPPEEGRTHLATLQWRKFFKRGKVAMNPNLVREFQDAVTSVTLPVYFFADANEGLAGGTKIGWRSDTKGLSFTVFVGTVLSIFD